jgi:hypothetical protein
MRPAQHALLTILPMITQDELTKLGDPHSDQLVEMQICLCVANPQNLQHMGETIRPCQAVDVILDWGGGAVYNSTTYVGHSN